MAYEEKTEWWGEVFGPLTAMLIILTVFTMLVAVPLYKTISTDGRADFCYVSGHVTTGQYPQDVNAQRYWVLEAHRPWRSDNVVGYAKTLEELRAMANDLGCKYHTEKP